MNIRTLTAVFVLPAAAWLGAQSPAVDDLVASGRYHQVAQPAKDGDPHALAAWAFARHQLAPGKDSLEAAESVYGRTADALAGYVLLRSLAEGHGIRRDPARIETLNRSIRETLLARSEPSAAELYVLGITAPDVDAAQRNQWLEAAARAGFAQAVNDLGMRAQALNDQVAAARQYEIAARLGLAEASRNLGRLCALRAVSSADAQRARGHTLAAAEAGDVVAMIDLADYCDHGFGGPADRAAAQGWLERAAGSGHWFGQLAKGKALLAGRYGLVADRDAGLRCFEQAVTSRCGPALLRVAEALARGDGFPADGKQAAVLAELAYVQGASEAASMLADLYTQGAASVVKDSDLAQFWRTRGGPPAAHTDDQDPRAARLEQLDPFATPIFQVAPR